MTSNPQLKLASVGSNYLIWDSLRFCCGLFVLSVFVGRDRIYRAALCLHVDAFPTPLFPLLPFRAIHESAFGTASPGARPDAEASQEAADECVSQSAASRGPFSACRPGARASAPHPSTRQHQRNQSGCREYALRSLRLDCRALMMRIVSLPCPNLRIVYTISSTRPVAARPSRFIRRSAPECPASSQSRPSKSANTVAASSKLSRVSQDSGSPSARPTKTHYCIYINSSSPSNPNSLWRGGTGFSLFAFC